MSRPVDWSPLDLPGDPVPGDPDVVESAGKHYQDVADAIETAARRLRQIADHAAMRSRAVDEMREKADEVADDIERAHTRYQGVGDALVAYAGPLRNAQAEADRARLDAINARDRLEQAQSRLASAESSLNTAVRDAAAAPADAPPADHSGLRSAVRSASGDVSAAEADLRRAKGDAEHAVRVRDTAAGTAISAIQDVEDSGDLNDSWWDNTGAKIVAEIASWAGAIAAFAGIAALVVGWIPVIGQALAAVLGTIALIAAAVSLLANLSLALTGYGSWTNVMLDAIGLATFGVGRAVIGGARAAYRGAQATARLNAGSIAATSRASRGGAGLPTGSSRSAIRTLVGSRSVSSMSRRRAASVLRSSRSVPSYNWTAPFRTAWGDIRALPSNLGTLTPGNITRAWQEAPAALTRLRNSSTMTEAMARLTQNSDTLAHINFTRGAHQAVQHGDQFARATQLTKVQFGSVGTAFAVDSYQATDVAFGSDPVAAQELNLDGEPAVGADVRR